MMVSSDDRAALPREGDEGPKYGKLLLAVLLGFAALLFFAVVLGAAVALFTGAQKQGLAIALALAGLLAGAAATWGVVRLKPWAGDEVVSPRIRKAKNLIWASAAIGAVIGVALSLATMNSSGPLTALSNEPLPAAVVIPILALWLLVVPAISWQWHRSVDEHELDAYRFGAVAGLYLYAFLAPAWWMAWRGDLMPEPDSMAIYVIVVIVWAAGWFWRRSR
jgi:hypothetical protein